MSTKLTAAHPHARELLHQAAAAIDALTFGDIVRLDQAAKNALVAADAIRQALRPEGRAVEGAVELERPF